MGVKREKQAATERTAVNLTPEAFAIKESLTVEWNLKKVLSAALVLFGAQDYAVQGRLIRAVASGQAEPQKEIAVALKLWNDLPQEVRGGLLNQELDANSLVDLVQQIVDETIEAGMKAQEELNRRRSRVRRKAGG